MGDKDIRMSLRQLYSAVMQHERNDATAQDVASAEQSARDAGASASDISHEKWRGAEVVRKQEIEARRRTR